MKVVKWLYAPIIIGALCISWKDAQGSIMWDFTPTIILNCISPPCTLTGNPVASLTLDSLNSTGSAVFLGGVTQATLTGDPFAFSLNVRGSSTGKVNISTTEPYGLGRGAALNEPWAIDSYGLSWTEINGVLEAARINLFTPQDELQNLILFTQTFSSARLISSLELDGCTFCDVEGVWTSTLVREPGSIILLLGSLLIYLGWRFQSIRNNTSQSSP